MSDRKSHSCSAPPGLRSRSRGPEWWAGRPEGEGKPAAAERLERRRIAIGVMGVVSLVTNPVTQGTVTTKALLGSAAVLGAAAILPEAAQAQPGPPGDPGSKGEPGPPGDPGAQGPQGDAGAPGSKGEPGPTGTPGTAGSAGAQGDTGPQGDAGAVGPKGEPGPDGAPGVQGAQGPAGPASTVAGPQGPQGVQGEKGEQGLAGAGFSLGQAQLTQALGALGEADAETALLFGHVRALAAGAPAAPAQRPRLSTSDILRRVVATADDTERSAGTVGAIWNNEQTIEGLRADYVRLRGESREGTAIAIALSGLRVPDGRGQSLSVRFGHFEGENALAGAGALRIRDNWTIDGGFSHGLRYSQTGYSLGLSYSW